MPSSRKFYRRKITIIVLSDEPYEVEDLADIAHDIVHGNQSGAWEMEDNEEISGPEMATALAAQGSDPEFFQLDKHGNDLECRKCASQLENSLGGLPTSDESFCSDETCPYFDWPQDVEFDADGRLVKASDRLRGRKGTSQPEDYVCRSGDESICEPCQRSDTANCEHVAKARKAQGE